ncbi:hypothetical protein VKT23_019921 [Stygiomarasmius scandens]|uniref:Protein kinase domain-containing protein n=1 Tax=Marasmiellus scandens TaxID=2682957 RepID=A0ABR1INW1_9AGAR
MSAPRISNTSPYTALPSDSPLSHKQNAYITWKDERNVRIIELAREMHGKFNGPMDNGEFLDRFLGKDAFSCNSVPPSPWSGAKAKFQQVPDTDVEKDMFPSLKQAILSCINSEQFEYIATRAYSDARCLDSAPDSAPDGTLYEKSRCADRTQKSDPTFSDMVTKIKSNKGSPGFNDSKQRLFERETETAAQLRGQLVSYTICQFANQYRTHLFMVFICGKTARLIRWDHAGATVTEAFRYDQESYLVEFYSRYTNATPEARGIDTSVKRLPMNNPLTKTVHQQLGLNSADPIYEFQVWNDPTKLTPPVENEAENDQEDPEEDKGYESDGEEELETLKEIPEEMTQVGLAFYGGKPFFSSDQSVVGRGTCIIKVWDPRHQAIVLLKDSWRVASKKIFAEGEVYAVLKANGVCHVPTCLRAGDVNPSSATQCTLTDTKQSRTHYRLVLREVCRGNITRFNDTKELIRVLCDGLIAHHDALKKCKLLHRDISAGNLLITPSGRGLLADWELCKFVPHLGEPRQTERTGTWQFISAALLKAAPACHTVKDDLESFFHVLGWTALQYTQHGLQPNALSWRLHNVYNDAEIIEGKVTGGSEKEISMKAGVLAAADFVPSAFCDLIMAFEETCVAQYLPDPDPEIVALMRKLLAKAVSYEERQIIASFADLRLVFAKDRLKTGL